MILTDVNVLLFAAVPELPDHDRYCAWLRELLDSPEAFGISELVLSSVVRISTNPKVFRNPATTHEAFAFTDRLREHPHSVIVQPGSRHWAIFRDLALRVSARANLIPDAYLAALAIESGSEWITTDRDYARFPGLRWRHPFND
jgi:toxin-antitoxin system PIN domain toxin